VWCVRNSVTSDSAHPVILTERSDRRIPRWGGNDDEILILLRKDQDDNVAGQLPSGGSHPMIAAMRLTER
jgi:tagatose-1,6-bisphosphate aldolase